MILISLALLPSVCLPSAISRQLLIGGGYLCFEVAGKLLHKNEPHLPAGAETPLTESEKDKIKGAVRTDFIPSAKIYCLGCITK